MHRFFVDDHTRSLLQPGQPMPLPEKLAHQVRDVLHLAVGEALILLDNSGAEYLATVNRSARTGVEVQIVERRAGQDESLVHIVLCQGMLKSARFEWVLEKGTELGVATFAPMLCRRSQSGLEDAGAAKMQRWQRIIQEAAEQCGRAQLPTLWPIRSLAQTLAALPAETLALIPWEEERQFSLHTALQNIGTTLHVAPSPLTVAVLIGPEGGLLAEEVQLARQHGAQAVTLGPRILRAETAALATVANVMYALEPLV